MPFAHHVPRKGLVSAHGAGEMLKDLDRPGYGRVLLKCDEPALVSVQKEVVRLRAKDTITENSPAGDSKANGVAQRGQVIRGANAGNPSRASRSVASSHSWESRFDILDG